MSLRGKQANSLVTQQRVLRAVFERVAAAMNPDRIDLGVTG